MSSSPLTLQEVHSKSKVCANVFCGAGRECAVNEKGEPSCLCIEVRTCKQLREFLLWLLLLFIYVTFGSFFVLQSCKPHKRSVCGSNGKTYRNHCELHRDACLTGLKIQVAHDGHCQGTSSGSGRGRTLDSLCLFSQIVFSAATSYDAAFLLI